MTYYKDPSEVPSVWIRGEEVSGKFDSLGSLIEALNRKLEGMEERINKVEKMLKAIKPAWPKTKHMELTKEEAEAIRDIVFQSENANNDDQE